MKAKGSIAPPPAEARQVLIVEDETRLREMLTRAIGEMGFDPVAVGTGEAALRVAEQRSFDILILDLNLPGISGLEMLAQLRGRQPDVQVVVLTGFGDLDAAKRAIHLDVAEFLTKPCPLGDLEQALDRARRRRLQATEPELPVVALDREPAPMRFIAVESVEPAGKTPSLEELERRHILAVLEKNSGNRGATAAELGISVRKLYYRLGQYQRQGLSS